MAINAKTFTARVLELDYLAAQTYKDLREMVHNRTAELAGEEEYLVVPSFTGGDVAAMPIADDNMTNGGSNTQIEIQLNLSYGYPIVVSESAQLDTNVALRDTYAQLAMLAHRKHRNLEITKGIADAADAADQHYKFADSTDDVISWDDILAAASILDNVGAPELERYMAIPATMHGDLFNIEQFISRDKMGQNGESIPSNVIGMLHGFTVVKLPLSQMAKVNASTGAGHLTTGQDNVLFWQRYGCAYAEHIYKLVGPEVKAGSASEWYNLWSKYGVKAQNNFAVSYRKNA